MLGSNGMESEPEARPEGMASAFLPDRADPIAVPAGQHVAALEVASGICAGVYRLLHPGSATAPLGACRLWERGSGDGRKLGKFLADARLLIDQIRRRLLEDEPISHWEKVFSIFEEHTRWISKGKAGCPVELGVPVCVVEDQHQFILGHEVLWEGGDTDVAVPIIEQCQERHPELRGCSFDRGFWSPANHAQLEGMLDTAALPKKGRLNAEERTRQADPEFVKARRQHPAIESAINGLGKRGLDRVRSRGPEGFARTVSLAIVAANLHRLGQLLYKRGCASVVAGFAKPPKHPGSLPNPRTKLAPDRR